jgi:phage terminase large subunit-like protein
VARIANLLDRPGPSQAEIVAAGYLDQLDDLIGEEQDRALEELMWDWGWWGRPSQQVPSGEWYVWFILAGRGFGKTRTGAETIRRWSEEVPLILVAGETAHDVRETMVEGESGILACSPPDNYPHYEPSKRRLTWPNGCRAQCLGLGEEPDLARGPQWHKGWLDEPAKWKYLQEAWDNVEMAVRLGDNPQLCVTGTPKPVKVVREMLMDAETITTHGSSYENIGNLSPRFIRRVIRRYEGTRLGRQELHAEVLDDVPGALWKRSWIQHRQHPDLALCVIAIDPATTSSEEANETGIIVAGRGYDANGYVIADRSGRMSPLEWGKRAVLAYLDFEADRITYEANQGGEMVATVISAAAAAIGVPTPPLKAVHASRGKRTRAEPISARYEQGRVFHTRPLETLEDQMCTWLPEDPSPDRMDAMVWALTDCLVEAPEPVDEELLGAIRRSSMH